MAITHLNTYESDHATIFISAWEPGEAVEKTSSSPPALLFIKHSAKFNLDQRSQGEDDIFRTNYFLHNLNDLCQSKRRQSTHFHDLLRARCSAWKDVSLASSLAYSSNTRPTVTKIKEVRGRRAMTCVDKKENIKHSKLRQLQVFQKVEYGGGPIFKVVLQCSKPFLIYIYGIQCDFMPKSCWKQSNFENR